MKNLNAICCLLVAVCLAACGDGRDNLQNDINNTDDRAFFYVRETVSGGCGRAYDRNFAYVLYDVPCDRVKGEIVDLNPSEQKYYLFDSVKNACLFAYGTSYENYRFMVVPCTPAVIEKLDPSMRYKVSVLGESMEIRRMD